MDCRVKAFLEGLKNKKIALIGIGRSNLPLVSLFTRYGACVTVCDRKRESEVEPQDLKQILDAGAQVCLGEDYLDKDASKYAADIATQFQALIDYLVGKPIASVNDLYRPGEIAPDVDVFSGATVRAPKVISAIWDALGRHAYRLD